MGDPAQYLEVAGHKLHYRLLHAEGGSTPLLFLHGGLGSVELWRDFPNVVVDRTKHPGLVYSRYGNGWSDPLTDTRGVDYMHEEALTVLPEIVERMLDDPPIIVGHSDGASIALIYAGAGHPVKGLVLIGPHVFVEDESIESIAAIDDEFGESDLVERMAMYHTDPEKTFRGWADIWLSSAFRSWNIEEYLPGVTCPTLLIQGDADQYGTLRQLDAVETGSPASATRVVVPGAAHSPHLTDPEPVTDAVVEFVGSLPP